MFGSLDQYRSKAIGYMQTYRLELIFALVVFLTHAYFYNGSSWNQNARYDLVYSIVEPNPPGVGLFQIDRFIVDVEAGINTGDWAKHDGHYYSNKAPGNSFLAVPLYFVLYHLESAMGFDTDQYQWVQFNAYMMNLWVSVFWMAVGSAFLVHFLRFLWGNTRSAMLDSLLVGSVFAFCTLAFPYDTQFWGHSTVAGMVLVGYAFLFRGTRNAVFFAGFILGLGVLVEYLAFGLLIPAILYLAIAENRRKHVFAFLAGVLPSIAILLIYQNICFGGYFVTASSKTNPIFIDQTKMFGQFGSASWYKLLDILFSYNRGIFLFMPILVVALANIRHLLERSRLTYVAVCLLNIGGCIYAISCFVGHHGGASSGMRYLVLIMPFFCLLLPRWSHLSTAKRYVVTGLGFISFANMFVIAAVSPMIRADGKKMWADYLYGPLLQGDFPRKTWLPHLIGQPSYEESALSAFNLGNLIGLKGLMTLVPWFMILAIGIYYLWQTIKKSDAKPTPRSPAELLSCEPITKKLVQYTRTRPFRRDFPLLCIALLALLLRINHFKQPESHLFDEFHYVPAAAVVVGLKPHPGLDQWKSKPLIMKTPDINFSHPPLGKFIIGWSMKIFGDNAIGWRVPAIVTGIFSLFVFYLLALRILPERKWALLATFLLSTDFLHIVQSRIGMLDIFLFLASTGLIYCFMRYREGYSYKWLVTAAVVSALGLSIKLPMALCVACFGILLLIYGAGPLWRRLRLAVIYGSITIACFCLWSIYFGFHDYSFVEWVKFVTQSSGSIMGKLKDHRYGSMPAEWIFNGGPVWYHYKSVGKGMVEGIVAMGNPLLWLSFIPASFLVFAEWRSRRRWQDLVPLIWYLFLYLPLFLILWNRQGFIYHMLPAVAPICLIVARACSLVFKRNEHLDWFVALVLGVVLFFLPVILGFAVDKAWMNAIQIFTGV